MSLFGKGTWTRLSIDPESVEKFHALLANQRALFTASAFAARSILIGNKEITQQAGINCPAWACGDAPFPLEQLTLDRKVHPIVYRQLQDPENQTPWEIPEGIADEYEIGGDRYFGGQFNLLDEATPVFGFWLVLFKRANLDDMNALKEHGASLSNGQPFKTLSSTAKKDITQSIVSDGLVDYIDRKQVPVILDYRTGGVWIGTGSKGHIDAFSSWMIKFTGTMVDRMVCKPGANNDWVGEALTQFHKEDLYKLEREEAFIEATTPEEESDPQAMEETEEGGTQPDTDEDKFRITNVATYAPDNGDIAQVETETAIQLPGARMMPLYAFEPLDAIALLRMSPDAEIKASKVAFKRNIGEGMAIVRVDANAELTNAKYSALDLDFNQAATDAMEINAIGQTIMSEETFAKPGCAPRTNLWWFRYHLMLTEAENMIYSIMCQALTLEPVFPASFSSVVMGTEPAIEGGEEEALNAVAREGVKAFGKSLLPGESVTITSGGKSTTIKKGANATETEIE
jgi:hypothetical protein